MDHFRAANSYIDVVRREVSWPVVFQSVKALVRLGGIPDEVRSTLKTWLKSNDVVVALMSITMLHTMTINCPVLRSAMASTKWFDRFLKQLSKPQSPLVGMALAQVIVDWAMLYSHEELGRYSGSALNAARSKYVTDMRPSGAAVAAAEEAEMGLPPVAPRKGQDFVKMYYAAMQGGGLDQDLRQPSVILPSGPSAMGNSLAGPSYAGASAHGPAGSMGGTGPGAAPAGGSGVGGAGGGQLLGGSQAEVSRHGRGYFPATGLGGVAGPADVPLMLQRIQAHSAELSSIAKAARTVANASKRASVVASHLDRGYVAAERCAAWRSTIQELAQTMEDAGSVAQLLSAADILNSALADWQAFASAEYFQILGLTSGPYSGHASATSNTPLMAGTQHLDAKGHRRKDTLEELFSDATMIGPSDPMSMFPVIPAVGQAPRLAPPPGHSNSHANLVGDIDSLLDAPRGSVPSYGVVGARFESPLQLGASGLGLDRLGASHSPARSHGPTSTSNPFAAMDMGFLQAITSSSQPGPNTFPPSSQRPLSGSSITPTHPQPGTNTTNNSTNNLSSHSHFDPFAPLPSTTAPTTSASSNPMVNPHPNPTSTSPFSTTQASGYQRQTSASSDRWPLRPNNYLDRKPPLHKPSWPPKPEPDPFATLVRAASQSSGHLTSPAGTQQLGQGQMSAAGPSPPTCSKPEASSGLQQLRHRTAAQGSAAATSTTPTSASAATATDTDTDTTPTASTYTNTAGYTTVWYPGTAAPPTTSPDQVPAADRQEPGSFFPAPDPGPDQGTSPSAPPFGPQEGDWLLQFDQMAGKLLLGDTQGTGEPEGGPGAFEVVSELRAVFTQMQVHYEGLLQAQAEAHREEIAEVKRVSVLRMRQLMSEQQQQQQQQPQASYAISTTSNTATNTGTNSSVVGTPAQFSLAAAPTQYMCSAAPLEASSKNGNYGWLVGSPQTVVVASSDNSLI